MEKYDYKSIADRFKKEHRVYLVAFAIIIIADLIGTHQFPIGPGRLILFPVFYGLVLGLILGPELIGFFKKEEVKAASPLVLVAIAPFIVKLGIMAGSNVKQLVAVGPALLLQEIGNLGTIFIALPVALLLGLKREAVGAAHSINRETNLALINNVYGPDSAEMRGTLSVYVVGGMLGTIYFGFLATLVASTGLFHPLALGMASGVGSGIMMAASAASLSQVYPAYADQIVMLAGASDMLSGLTGIYAALFLALPITNKLYAILEPRIGRRSKNNGNEIRKEQAYEK
jgi:hypothetical protein